MWDSSEYGGDSIGFVQMSLCIQLISDTTKQVANGSVHCHGCVGTVWQVMSSSDVQSMSATSVKGTALNKVWLTIWTIPGYDKPWCYWIPVIEQTSFLIGVTHRHTCEHQYGVLFEPWHSDCLGNQCIKLIIQLCYSICVSINMVGLRLSCFVLGWFKSHWYQTWVHIRCGCGNHELFPSAEGSIGCCWQSYVTYPST